jgi:alpha-galactosidase
MTFTDAGEIQRADQLVVYEHGWQSWSPTATYPAASTSPRPADRAGQVMGYRPDKRLPEEGFQGEGLLAVAPTRGGPVRIWSASDPTREVASIRARSVDGRLVVSADGPVTEVAVDAPGLDAALAAWADGAARACGAGPVGSIPAVWCSWYQYFGGVTAAAVTENLGQARRLDLPIGVFQLDDGFSGDVGDWLSTSDRFGRPLDSVAGEIRAEGHRAGIWTAPLLVGERSRIRAAHPGWLVGGADAGRNWGQHLHVLDVTHPDAAEHLATVFRRLSAWGFDYFKLDFLYAGALPGRRRQDASAIGAYREALRLIRAATGPGATLLGCGAPILPSLGLVDAMRVGPDIAIHHEPLRSGDLSAPSGRGAAMTVRARAFQHGRFWVNDPDCLIARAEMEGREEWAEVVERWGGLRASGDRLATLDAWGLETTRRLLTPSSPRPLVPTSDSGHEPVRGREAQASADPPPETSKPSGSRTRPLIS